jgi:pyruvate kinase
MMERRAKIVATLGPSSQNDEILRKLILAGMDVARLNFSHGTHADHLSVIQLLRKLSQELNKPVTILQDLQGPKLRVGLIPEPGINLVEGTRVILSNRITPEPGINPIGQNIVIPTDLPDLHLWVKVGNPILLDDGNLELRVTQCLEDEVEAIVIQGGTLTSHKGINLPGAPINIPGFTDKDRSDLLFGIQNGIEVVAVSFVRTSADILVVREFINTNSPNPKDFRIIAKIERPEAIENLEDILSVVDGVMVARGDLAVETSPALVPVMQKQIIQSANQDSKIVITATQMLDSMIHNPRPTRAEASDVANAIFDGTDAVMLSAETASGLYPLESIKMMDSIILEAEKHYSEWSICNFGEHEPTDDDAISMSHAARELAHDRNVAAIAVFTVSGRTAILMSKARPSVQVLAFTHDNRTYQRLNLLWGVLPVLIPFANSLETMLKFVDKALVSSTPLVTGQQVVLITGFPISARRSPNLAILHTIED